VKKAIGYRIRKLRESKDYSQDNMGVELGITAGAYAKIERGETDPSATRLLQIADILGVDVNVFFHDTQSGSRVEETQKQYGTASKNDIDEIKHLIRQMNGDIANLKIEIAGLKKLPGSKAKKK
jgi:transcriptional regulator with XRE-family HTH domain